MKIMVNLMLTNNLIECNNWIFDLMASIAKEQIKSQLADCPTDSNEHACLSEELERLCLAIDLIP